MRTKTFTAAVHVSLSQWTDAELHEELAGRDCRIIDHNTLGDLRDMLRLSLQDHFGIILPC